MYTLYIFFFIIIINMYVHYMTACISLGGDII